MSCHDEPGDTGELCARCWYVHTMQRHLTIDLAHPLWRRYAKACPKKKLPLGFGCCYVAAEALYHLWGKEKGFKPARLRTPDVSSHWLLKHPTTGEIVDPTEAQFDERPLEPADLASAKFCGFLTGDKPSKRCQKLLVRMGQSNVLLKLGFTPKQVLGILQAIHEKRAA
jgi:hypothetical protein